MIKVIFPGGDEKDFNEGSTFFEVLKDRDKGILKKAVAVKANGELKDLRSLLQGTVSVEPVFIDSPEGLEILRHSASHVMAQAVKALYVNVKLAIGPAISDGFYYDFDTEHSFVPEDLEKIEAKMREIIKADYPFAGTQLPTKDGVEMFRQMGEIYKEEIIGGLDGETISIYRQGDFADLCRGPHLPSTGWIKAFKLTGTAGAYWRGDEKNKMLQRVYGTAFATKEDLKAHLDRLEEAKRRDHRKLGRELDLFTTSEDIGSGLVLWHPNGATVRMVIEDFWKAEHVKGAYSLVYTTHIANVGLWKTSGHWDFYK